MENTDRYSTTDTTKELAFLAIGTILIGILFSVMIAYFIIKPYTQHQAKKQDLEIQNLKLQLGTCTSKSKINISTLETKFDTQVSTLLNNAQNKILIQQQQIDFLSSELKREQLKNHEERVRADEILIQNTQLKSAILKHRKLAHE
ncbi:MULTISPECIES: hypothetical protein [unclassified Vibrio]|uniref:hypothetical protein n=1 Tax=unclassified Vibrio TaxID=2614977 RepID=UPI00354EFA5C